MKKVFISFFIMTLALTNLSFANISSVQATTTDNTIKVSLENIRDIILENNPQAKIYENIRDNEKLSYDDAKDTKKSKESEYNNAKSEYNTAQAKYNEDPVNNAKPSETTVTDAETVLEDAKTTLNAAKYALRTANNTYNEKLQSLVETAQNDYISYVSNDLHSKDYNAANVKLLKKKADIAKIQYDSVFLSKDDYTTAQLNYTTALNYSNKTNDAEENDKVKLLYDLGLSSEENVIFDTNLEQDIKDVSTINYDNDLKQMLNNNLTLQNDNIEIEQASDDKDNESDSNTDNQNIIIDNNLESAKSQLVLDKNKAEKDFKTKYDALINSYVTMKNSYDNLIQKINEYNIMQREYDYGFASQESVDQANVSSLEESKSYQSDKSTFYAAYFSYIQAKEGY